MNPVRKEDISAFPEKSVLTIILTRPHFPSISPFSRSFDFSDSAFQQLLIASNKTLLVYTKINVFLLS